MVKPKVSLDEIPVGRSRVQRSETTAPSQETKPVTPDGVDEPKPTTSNAPAETRSSEEPPQERGGLRGLKALRPQNGAYVLTVSLEERLRDRLARASFESKVKQTKIVREALDEFLRKEGY